ncbi:MAG: InlB B-repeat-containing protein [Clostridia bacterium]|nr:InlB B-repeat-containing protein [Clostridia bacterium]
MKKKTRLLSLLLALSMLLGLVPISVYSEGEQAPIRILHDGAEIAELLLYQDGKETLEVETTLDGTLSYRWQILTNAASAEWVNISGMTQAQCDVSYALVGSLLDEAGQTQLRCTVSDGTDVYVSPAVTVTVSYTAMNTMQERAVPLANTERAVMRAAAPLTAAAANDEIKEVYNITINYVYKDGTIARDPNVLSIAAETDVNHTIPNPVIVGYSPVLQEAYEHVELVTEADGSTAVKLSYDALDAPKIINVIYMPALVDFVVHHYRQNLLDDNYESTPYQSVTMKGYTGESVGDCHIDIDGFHALYYERMVIAADGSTQVEIYYDREYYLVSFDLGGGFGVEPIYTRYGSEIGVNTPTRPGYDFTAWSLTSVAGLAPTADDIGRYLFTDTKTTVTVEKSLGYLALWARGYTSYTMVFWQENANDDDYSYWGSVTVDKDASNNSLLVGDTVSAQDWVSRVSTIDDEQYFTYNAARSDHDVVLKGDGSTIVNVYYTRNRYTITFVADGVCMLDERHTHSDACYTDICGSEHVHTDECESNLICEIPEHTDHTSDCLECGIEEHIHGVHCPGAISCGKEEHTHSPACCTLTEHTHGVSCYPNVGSQVSAPATSGWPNYHSFPTNATNGYVARFRSSWGNNTYYYIYINGNWYNYTSSASNGAVIKVNCGLSEHTHGGTGCMHCDREEHIHTSDCVSCEIEEHIHGESCYKDQLHTHGEDCYEYPSCEQHIHEDSCMMLTCAMPTGHTHTTACDRSDRESTVKMVTRKYQASLSDIWPIVDENGVIYNAGQRWTPSDSSYYNAVLVYISNMPADDFTLTVNESNYHTFNMHYMLEVLPGEAYTATYNGKNFIESFSVNANYNYITRDEDFFDIKGFEQYGSNPTFSNNQINQDGGDVYFYYRRQTGGNVVLSFQNVNTVVQSYSGGDIMYGMSLEEYRYQADGTEYIPPYPDTYEPNAYQFDQWFTTPECFPGTEVNWDTLTMPDGALTLYAHWIPQKHTVQIFKDASLTEQLGATFEVDHGTLLADPGHPSNGQLIFSGWFYKDDNGVEKAFIFNGIPVKDDMVIYAKWGSRVAVQYTVYYVYVDENGNEIEVAPPTVGSTIAGQNRTFDAKGGNDLYEAYREGYFPDAASHSIVMSAESENKHIFYYHKRDGASYTVRYLDEQGQPLVPDKVVEDNKLAVVTETFVSVSGYMPDAYQKRLIVSVNTEENVLVFNYTKDEVHAYYRVVQYWQNLDGEGYTEHSYSDIKATIGSICAASPITITGFDFKEAQIDGTVTALGSDGSVRGTLDADGMLIAFYYDRRTVEYTVDYVEYGNADNHLIPSVTKTGLYGAMVEESAPNLTQLGYSRVSEPVQRITLKETGRNLIVFSYQENSVSYQYMAIMGDALNPSYASENVSALTGSPVGCTPIASGDYTFAGWFKDAACTVAVDPAVDPVTVDASGKLIPEKSDSDGDGTYLFEGGVYYAKFDYNFTNLTIAVEGSSDDEQAFLFVVQGVDGTSSAGVNITVAVKGNSSVNLENVRVGDYRVTQLTDWSWRYMPNGVETVQISVSPRNESNTVTFTQDEQKDKWLDGNGHAQFLFP